MTNSTDKAAASAAIRVAPRRGRVKAGVVLDRDGVTVVQSREGIDAIGGMFMVGILFSVGLAFCGNKILK